MNKTVIVSVTEGKLRGIKKISKFSQTEFYSFYGIPYGEPPVKNLRFKDPIKAKPWKSIRDATTETREGCTQYSYQTYTILGSEDCLYSNIYTPQLPSDGVPLMPVIVLIHPGGFRWGSPETWSRGSPDFIMHHDVVYVCIAFRLHILGFLNLNIKECSGNQCLKDIILALKWIKENIHNFNGDPNNITLLGSSSGANTINLLLLSPAAKGLFHKAVMTSFIFLVYTTYQDENETVGFALGRMLGFQGTATERKKLLKILKNTSAEVLVVMQRECEKCYGEMMAPVFPQCIFLPTIDAASETPVIPISPRKLIDSITPVPLMFGLCERESILGFSRFGMRELTEKYYRTGYRQNQWSWMYDLNDDEMKRLNDQVEKFYLKDLSFEDAPLSVKVDMLTEVGFHEVYDTLINPMAEKLPSSVYLYKYLFDCEMSDVKNFVLLGMEEKLSGSYHSCDFACWSYNKLHSFTKRNVRMINTYTKLVTTFAKNGDPNYDQLEVKWRPSTVEKTCYLSINDELQMVDGEFYNNSVEFWKNIKKQFKKD